MARPRAVQLAVAREVVHLNGLSATPTGVRIDVLAKFGGKPGDVVIVQNLGKKDIKVHLAGGGVPAGYATVRTKEDKEFEVSLPEFWVSGPNEPFDVTLIRKG